LLFFDPRKPAAPEQRQRIKGQAGAVRSIHCFPREEGGSWLLLGAAVGVYCFPLDHAAADRCYLVPGEPAVKGGFNSVALADGMLFAAHSELGIWAWNVDAPDFGIRYLEAYTGGAQAVRGLRLHGRYLYCSRDQGVLRWEVSDDPDEQPHLFQGSRSTITALLPTYDGLYAGNVEGEVLFWTLGAHESPEWIHRGARRPVESIALLESHGIQRLIFTDTSPAVHARVIGDSFTCRYEAGGQTLRRAETAPDLIVATTELRDRLICWNPAQPDRPQAILPVAALCGHSVQDVCLVREG
jgi:hypothetical protein